MRILKLLQTTPDSQPFDGDPQMFPIASPSFVAASVEILPTAHPHRSAAEHVPSASGRLWQKDGGKKIFRNYFFATMFLPADRVEPLRLALFEYDLSADKAGAGKGAEALLFNIAHLGRADFVR